MSIILDVIVMFYKAPSSYLQLIVVLQFFDKQTQFVLPASHDSASRLCYTSAHKCSTRDFSDPFPICLF